MRPVRVLAAITGMAVGGAERVLIELANSLPADQVEGRIVSFTNDTRAYDTYGVPPWPRQEIDMRAGVLNATRRIGAYARLLREFRPDIIHAHMFHALMFTLAAVQTLRPRPKIVFTSHTAWLPKSRERLVAATRPLRACDIILAPDQHPKLNARRTVVIGNGVKVDTCRPPPPPRPTTRPARLIFVGRISIQKNPQALLRAFAAADIGEAELDMVGVGPMEDEIRDLIVELGLQDRVRLLGLRSDVRDLLRQADGMILHSRWEGLPMVALEAGAEGLPVLSTPVGAMPALLADGRGYIATPETFSAVLTELVADAAGAAERGRRLKAHVAEHYSAGGMAAQHLALYRSLAPAG